MQTVVERVFTFHKLPWGITLGSRNNLNYVYQIQKEPPANQNYEASMKYKNLIKLLGLIILKIQDIDISLYSLPEIESLVAQHEKSSIVYVTFGMNIKDMEHFELKHFNPISHLEYFSNMIYSEIPAQYSSMDCQRMTLLFFSIFGVDILSDINQYFSETKKSDIIHWVYAQQIIGEQNNYYSGFRGSSFLGIPFIEIDDKCSKIQKWDRINMSATHNALCILNAFDDDLSNVDRHGILNTLNILQDKETGSYFSMIDGELDIRFLYCACVICYILDDFTGIPNKTKAIQYLCSLQTYDGSMAFEPGLEGHGGSTFLVISSLKLLLMADEQNTKTMDDCINIPLLLRWCLFNQGNGFCGRVEKPADSCYSFWIGAVLKMIGNETDYYSMTYVRFNRIFNILCQSGFGGFSKLPVNPYGDILHGYMCLVGLRFMNDYHSEIERNKFYGQYYIEFPFLFQKKVNPVTTCSAFLK